ncbi:Pr6Pr family membrane protein [Dyella silvatica]|uniref:Pr6Pr family membrane protein n=1 Tax=Dyella silvatica TaxID=2992128 RepID=UPI0022582077|nr:Pr6Pr family membrane protein [Dyella silvatica]
MSAIPSATFVSRYRAFAATAALLEWLALALQLYLSIQITNESGQGAWAGVWIYFGFFTTLTNLLVALALTATAWGPRGQLSRFLGRPSVYTCIAMSIVVVGALYNALLRQLWHPEGWQLVADVILHDIMPVLFLLYWWFAVPKKNLHWRQLGYWLLYPAAYFLYVLARGAVNGWYPYPFLDVSALGYAQVWIDGLAVLLAFVVVAVLLIALGRWQARLPTT